MAQYGKIIDGIVSGIVELDPALHQSWVASGNPKAAMFLPYVPVPPPPYDPQNQTVLFVYEVVNAIGTTPSVTQKWTVRPLTADEKRKTYTALEFLSRFTEAELNSVEIAREADSVVRDFYRSALAAQEVVSDDPRTVAGMGYLVSINLLTANRAAQILG